MLIRKGVTDRVIKLLEPLAQHSWQSTRKKTLPLLLEAYERKGEIVKAALVRKNLEDLENQLYS